MNVKPWIVGAVAWIAFRSMQKLKAVQQFTYNLLGLPTVTLSGSLAVITVGISIANITGERFNIQKVFGVVAINGLQIGTLSSAAPVSIIGYSSAMIKISLTTEISNAVLALISALATKTNGVTVSVSGSVVTDSITVPMIISKKF